jgi:hypothetical protein
MLSKPDDFSDREWRELLLGVNCLSDKHLTRAILWHRECREIGKELTAAAIQRGYARYDRTRNGERYFR